MMSTVKNSLGVLPQKTSESDGTPNRSQLFENQSAVPLEFMQRLDQRLERAVMENPEWKDTRSVKVERTSEGLLITFFDNPGKPLFQSGARGMTEYGQLVFETVGWEVARYPQVELELNGHTSGEAGTADGDPWELSAIRANSARQLLLNYGVKPSQIRKISGMGSEQPLPDRPRDDPGNRRVAIVVRAGKVSPKTE
jgi:chemotaxis protein MotB